MRCRQGVEDKWSCCDFDVLLSRQSPASLQSSLGQAIVVLLLFKLKINESSFDCLHWAKSNWSRRFHQNLSFVEFCEETLSMENSLSCFIACDHSDNEYCGCEAFSFPLSLVVTSGRSDMKDAIVAERLVTRTAVFTKAWLCETFWFLLQPPKSHICGSFRWKSGKFESFWLPCATYWKSDKSRRTRRFRNASWPPVPNVSWTSELFCRTTGSPYY